MRLHLLQKVLRLPQAALKRAVTVLLQLVLLVNRPARLARSGFVLPTTVLLVLMVVLTVTALTYRSFTRSDMAISQREQQVISNAATPAIDRAKAKIEFLFQTDQRFPSGLPASDILADLMLVRKDFPVGWTKRVSPLAGADDPYTLPDETRLDINRDGQLDNAWSFKADIDGKDGVGANELVVYSILVDDQASPGNPVDTDDENEENEALRTFDGLVDQTKANALVTRTGPLAVTAASPLCAGALAEGGWQVVQQGNNSTLQKNFQVNAFVANANDVNRTFETLEFQQSRSAARANKWGAWFRYDLDVSPGPAFNWNGAMHTDGSFMTFAPSGNGATTALRSHMVSSYNSCIYSKESSEISMSQVDEDKDDDFIPSEVIPNTDLRDFQGQAVRGNMVRDETTSNGVSTIHVWDQSDDTIPLIDRTLTATNDSVRTNAANNNVRPSDVAINPLVLFTRDITQHINPDGWQRDPEWDKTIQQGNDNFRTRERIINDEVSRPFVDDFFRADNRWGPKPRYDSRDKSLDMENPVNAGATTGSTINGKDKLTEPTGGLDGYWERRANTVGMKLIVGERLELGNANGWNSDPITGSPWSEPTLARTRGDALYPAKIWPKTTPTGSTDINGRYGLAHEYRQRKALRDNLAAVQGMVVYHYRINEDAEFPFPAACMAMTAHPGTQASIVQSRTFTNWLSGGVKTSFLTGRGTNGWEFDYNSDFKTSNLFEAAYNSNNSPLKKALSNLAYFAGDPSGGAPSFPPLQDSSVVHPYPYLAMWGDFSVLRRILASPTPYDKLSPADQSTLHSAACTLGLLAYNLDKQKTDFDDFITAEQWAAIADSLLDLVENDTIPVADVEKENWLQFVPENDPNIQEIQAASEYFQIQRDRTFGFRAGKGLEAADSAFFASEGIGFYVQDPDPTNDESSSFTFLGTPPPPYDKETYRVGCDPNLFVTKGVTDVSRALTLALALCPKTEPTVRALSVKYPSLYYLFPRADHNQYENAEVPGIATTAQPPTEEYIDATYPVAATPGNIPNYPVINTYKVVGAAPDDLEALAAQPRLPGAWVLPYTSNPTGSLSPLPTGSPNRPDDRPFAITNPAGGILNVTFLDKGVYNGREQLNARVLDIDLEAITRNQTQTSGGDYWLSADLDRQAEGVVYAFREDAVREDEIVRPKSAIASITSDFCQTLNTATPRRFNLETQANCRMLVEPNPVATANTFRDPPLAARGVSLKPVDFFADPDRRVHGFRLRTADINRPADFSGPATLGSTTPGPRKVGMTFVTDNSVYIQGDFNPHSTNGSVTAANLLEEFTQKINGTPPIAFGAPFYNDRTTLNTASFATLTQDHWRPVEILADAITLLSSSFRDGSVEDGFIKAIPAATTLPGSSYTNQNRPALTADEPNWVRESTVAGSPVWIDRNGTYYRNNVPAPDPSIVPFYADGAYNTAALWTEFTDYAERQRNLQRASRTFINATFISGLVPQRPQQGYGGLHNFVRFLEDWNDTVELFISGSFIQLNFSTNATGPFEHDAWQPDQPPNVETVLGYYRPPQRRWGYDVALLYLPPAPAARRFVNIGAPRSEYYRELPANDPYIANLRCATKGSPTDFVFDEANIRGTCPPPA